MRKYKGTLQISPPGLDPNDGPWFLISGPDLPGNVFARLGTAANGQYVCTGLIVDSPSDPLTSSGIRNVPINQILDSLVEQAGGATEDVVLSLIEDVDLEAHGGFVVGDLPNRLEAERPKRGGKGPSDDDLRLFAYVYKRALNSPSDRHRPIAAVVDELRISAGTAYRWRAACERRGLLEPS